MENGIKIIRKNWRKFLRIFEKRTDSHIVFFTDDIVQKYANCHKMLQAAIIMVSNYRAGLNVRGRDFHPRAIYKAEGGVNVDHKEIVIKRRYGVIICYNDWDNKEKDTSKIVKEVVEEILKIQPGKEKDIADVLIEYVVKNTDIPKDIVREKMYKFVSNPFVGDMLNRLFSR